MTKEPCYCDLVYCKDPICSRLAELRIAWKIISELLEHKEHRHLDTPEHILHEIESECEILVK